MTYKKISTGINQEDFEVVGVAVPAAEPLVMDRSEEPDPKETEEAVFVGAATAGALIGCIVGGPILACASGGCCAYLTTRSNTTAGDAARCFGRCACQTKAKAMEVNDKHHVVERTKTAAVSCWNTMKDANERHHLMERTQTCLGNTWNGVKDINEKYRLSERSLKATASACGYVATKIEKILIEEQAGAEEDRPAASTEQRGGALDEAAEEMKAAAEVQEEENADEEEGESRFPSLMDHKKGKYVAISKDPN